MIGFKAHFLQRGSKKEITILLNEECFAYFIALNPPPKIYKYYPLLQMRRQIKIPNITVLLLSLSNSRGRSPPIVPAAVQQRRKKKKSAISSTILRIQKAVIQPNVSTTGCCCCCC